MKKFWRIGLAAALSLALAACGSSSSADTEAAADTEAQAEESEATEAASEESDGRGRIAYMAGTLGDKSFIDSGEAGMNVLRSEGWEVRTVETGDSTDADKYEDYFLDILDQGYDYIIAASTYMETMAKLAPDYPDVKFIGFDEHWSDEQLPDNMTCLFYAQNEGSYLVGMLAAAMSETGTVGVDVGIETPGINDFVTGYIDGVMAWNEAHGTDVKVVKAACGSWTDPATMKSLVLDQIRNNNADVFFQVAGGSGDGLFEACLEQGKWAIGVDSDQYAAYIDSENPEKAEVILTSMLKEVGNSLVDLMHRIENGDDSMWGHTVNFGLADDSISYVDNDYFKEVVPEEVRNEMQEAKEKIASGEIDVKSYYDFTEESEYADFVASAG